MVFGDASRPVDARRQRHSKNGLFQCGYLTRTELEHIPNIRMEYVKQAFRSRPVSRIRHLQVKDFCDKPLNLCIWILREKCCHPGVADLVAFEIKRLRPPATLAISFSFKQYY